MANSTTSPSFSAYSARDRYSIEFCNHHCSAQPRPSCDYPARDLARSPAPGTAFRPRENVMDVSVQGGRWGIIAAAVMRRPGLTLAAKAVYATLATYADRQG